MNKKSQQNSQNPLRKTKPCWGLIRTNILAAVALFSTYPTEAATLAWDTAGSTDIWTTTAGNTNWLPGPVDWTDGNAALFDNAAGEAVTITGAVNPTSVTVGTNNGTWSFTGAGAIGGASTLAKNGTGTLTISTANSYSGLTTVSAGVLNIQNATALGTTAGGTTVTSGAALELQGGITVGAEALTISGTGATSNTGALRNISGNNEWQGTITSGTSGTISSDSGLLTLSAANSITGSSTLFLRGAGNGTVLGTVTIGGAQVQKNGAGTWTLAGANTYTGATTIFTGKLITDRLANGGTASGIGQSANTADKLVLWVGTTLQYTGGAQNTDRLFSLHGGGGSTIDASGSGALSFTNTGAMGFDGTTTARTLILSGTNTGNNTLAAAIGDNTGATSLTKSGGGKWIVSGTSTYTGTTTISAGTLIISGSLINTTGVVVSSGATLELGAADLINNSANLTLSGATLKSGFAETLGTLTLTTATASTLDFSSGDSILLFSGITSGTGTLAITNWTSGSDSLRFTSNTNLVAGSFTINGAAATILDNHLVTGYYEVVPEPSTWALVASSLATVIILRRRHSGV